MIFFRRVLGYIHRKLFLEDPQYGLQLLYILKLDILFYTLPVFYFDNRKSFQKLKRLKKQNKKFISVIHVDESDGRFQRFNAITQNDDRLVVFKYRTSNNNVEKYYFKSYAAIPIGFYEDARQRYILPSNDQNRKNYRKHCTTLLNTLERFTGKIHYFCSGSNNDRWIVEMIEAAQARSTSWVICEREGTSTDIGYEMEGNGFKISNSLVAHYHFLANDKHTKMIDDAKTDSVRLCKTIGELDTDWRFHYNKNEIMNKYSSWNSYQKVELFLTFGERNYIEPTLFPEHKDITWQPLLIDCEETLIDYAIKNPRHLVIYRMGHKEDKNLVFLNKIKNLKLTNIVESYRSSSSFSELAIRADLIIGFQSTAMYESMFTDKPIIQVFWHIMDFLDPVKHILPISDYGACLVAKSKNEFRDLLEKFSIEGISVGEKELAARIKTREIMFKNADGKMAERFVEEIIGLSKTTNNELSL